ncbi:MAG: helix-turn-helix domain-containing protein [Spirochaetota bacterium]
MESIAEKLRNAREEKGYSLEQVARDTHIAKRYITAMESEDFSVFPGEPYVIGFLKNYSSYLGLNPNEVVNLYRNIKLQEQPAPIDELLDRPRWPRLWKTIIVVLIILLLGVGGFLLFGEALGLAAATPGHSVLASAGNLPL